MPTKISTVLVTGGAGFIGSHSVVELLNAGYEVVAIDNFSNSVEDADGNAVSLKRVEQITGKKVAFYKVDILDKPGLTAVFKKHKVDCVIHFAALKAVNESLHIPLTYYRVNVAGTINLLDVMKEFGVFNVVFSSSCTVYGPPKYLPIDENHPRGEGVPSVYGKTKVMMEQIFYDLHASDPKSWHIVLLRYFNPCGAHPTGLIGEDPLGIPNGLMPYVAQVAVGKLPKIHVYGSDWDTPDGSGVRDYIHIVDLAVGHVAALRKLETSDIGCQPYNLGTGRGYSVLEMIRAFNKACGKELPYVVEGRRDGDVSTVYNNTAFAEKELGWKAQFGLDEMCRDLWNWQNKNPNGFSPSP